MIEVIKSNISKLPMYAVTKVGLDGKLEEPIISTSKEEITKVFAMEILNYAASQYEKGSSNLSLEFKQIWPIYANCSIREMVSTTDNKKKLNEILTALNYNDSIKFTRIGEKDIIPTREPINLDDICGFMNSTYEDNVYKVFKNIRMWIDNQVNIALDIA